MNTYAKRVNPTEDVLISRITQALNSATEAVQKDNNGEYPVCIQKYIEACEILRSELPNCPSSNHASLQEKIDLYQNRINVLERHISTSSVADFDPASAAAAGDGGFGAVGEAIRRALRDHGDVAWSEMGARGDAAPTLPSCSAAVKPYALLQLLFATVHDTDGAPLASSVFVPRNVWLQRGAKFPAVEAKIATLSALLEGLQKLNRCEWRDSAVAARELESFVGALDESRTALSKTLTFIRPGQGAGKGILGSLGAKIRQASSTRSDDAYLELVAEVMNAALPLREWVEEYEKRGANAPMEWLARVSDYWMTVLLPMLVRDLYLLLDSYMTKCSESFLGHV